MSFYERIKHSQIATENIAEFLGGNVQVQRFGIESIGDSNSPLRRFLSLLPNNYNDPTAMLLEYLPDYIVFTGTKVFFLEAKVSITPCWSRQRIREANHRVDQTIDASNCGEIAREPFLAYRKYFPHTVILYVNNYNKNAVLAQYAKDVQCLRCEKNSIEQYECELCPLRIGGFYDAAERNQTQGSGTPSTNINLDSFVPARKFFENEFGICINEKEIQAVEDAVASEKLRFGRSTTMTQKKNIVSEIWSAGNHRIRCPKCGGDLVERTNHTERTIFLGCSNYTGREGGCDFTASLITEGR